MSFAIINILSAITAETANEDTPFYAPTQMDLMDYMEFQKQKKEEEDHIRKEAQKTEEQKRKDEEEEYEKFNLYVDLWLEAEEEIASKNFFLTNNSEKTRHRNHRKHMIADKKKLHHRKEVYGTYRNLNFHSDGWMADYAKAQYAMGNRRVRQTYDIPSGKAGYKKLNGKGIW